MRLNEKVIGMQTYDHFTFSNPVKIQAKVWHTVQQDKNTTLNTSSASVLQVTFSNAVTNSAGLELKISRLWLGQINKQTVNSSLTQGLSQVKQHN